MAPAPRWRQSHAAHGPFPIGPNDIPGLNTVFSDAFTERYRRDGMVGVRVPFLNPAIWRYAIEDAGKGAMLWRDDGGEILAFNIVHCSGVEGWMGPLAVRADAQEGGVGKLIVRTGKDWLARNRAAVIGLETMPRTMDNIGFYSALGFEPGRLTITVTIGATVLERPAPLLGRLRAAEKQERIADCAHLASRIRRGYDFTREIVLTDEMALGDTLLLLRGDDLRGFALYHTAPLVEGRVREELRVLKLVLADERDADEMVRQLADQARRAGTRQVALRVQGEFLGLYNRLIALGGRVRWTDLRMTAQEYPEPPVEGQGVVLSNWEI